MGGPKVASVTGDVRVRVREPFQVSLDGEVFGPGVVVEVSGDVAQHWTRNGWADIEPD